MDPLRRNFRRRLQNEPPPSHPRMGQRQPGRLNRTAAEKQQIQVDDPRRPSRASRPAEFLLDRLKTAEKNSRPQRCFDNGRAVEIRWLTGGAAGGPSFQPTTDAHNPGFGQTVDPIHRCFEHGGAVAPVRSQTDQRLSHGRRLSRPLVPRRRCGVVQFLRDALAVQRLSVCRCVSLASRQRTHLTSAERSEKHGRLGWGHPGHSAGAPAVGPYGCATQDSRCSLFQCCRPQSRLLHNRAAFAMPGGTPVSPSRRFTVFENSANTLFSDQNETRPRITGNGSIPNCAQTSRFAATTSFVFTTFVDGESRRRSAHSPQFEQLVKSSRNAECALATNGIEGREIAHIFRIISTNNSDGALCGGHKKIGRASRLGRLVGSTACRESPPSMGDEPLQGFTRRKCAHAVARDR